MRRRRADRQHQYRSAEYRELQARLAGNVRSLREHRGWTQEETAERASMATPVLQRIEAANANVTLTTLARLCRGLQEDIQRLFAPARALAMRPRGRPRKTPRR